MAALDLIPWDYSGLKNGKIRADVARRMATSTLIGPDNAMIDHDGVRVGLFMQGPGLDYPTRHHAAEETFYIISGTAEWRVDGGTPKLRPPGDYVHHASGAPHSSSTRAEPLLAAWRWTGDVSHESYVMSG